MRMDNETKYFIQDEVRRQLTEAIDAMHKALVKKAKKAQPWWRRVLTRMRSYVDGLIFEYKRQQWERLPSGERMRREDAWLSGTLSKLRGNAPVPHRHLELGEEGRDVVLQTDFVKHILDKAGEVN